MRPGTRITQRQTKKQPGSRRASTHTAPLQPRRPLGVQCLGPVRYEALRRALHQLDAVAER